MTRFLASICALFLATPSFADVLVPTRSFRANTILSAHDFQVQPGEVFGALTHPDQVDGMEARVALYAGRPVRQGDVSLPAVVERNALVRLVFAGSGLAIVTEGRALGRGTIGDSIRVMNLSSKNTLLGVIQPDGSIKVGP